MDLSLFASPNFNVTDWVNGVFAQDCSAGYPTSQVMKLQLSMQDVSRRIEDTSTQVICALPRIIRDVEMLRQESVLLREKMRELQSCEADLGENNESIRKLEMLGE